MLRTYTNFYIWNNDVILKYKGKVERVDPELCSDCLDCEFKLMNISNCTHIAYSYATKKVIGFYSISKRLGFIKYG